MQVDMAGKPRARCPLFPVCLDISTAPDNKVEFFPAVFSDVMPLWFGLIPGGCTKGSAAIWSVIPQLWVKLRNFHLGEDASPSLSLLCARTHACSPSVSTRSTCAPQKVLSNGAQQPPLSSCRRLMWNISVQLCFSAPVTLTLLFTRVEHFQSAGYEGGLPEAA